MLGDQQRTLSLAKVLNSLILAKRSATASATSARPTRGGRIRISTAIASHARTPQHLRRGLGTSRQLTSPYVSSRAI